MKKRRDLGSFITDYGSFIITAYLVGFFIISKIFSFSAIDNWIVIFVGFIITLIMIKIKKDKEKQDN
ncbi:hypothetical protein FC756_01020 [Lysinibacillus mangiferihumi]|uniref:Uncharacterized protein n=1 Tax=Lysinibacillus mangiferihumi TaxID=1130819 RepID=A0A4U2ZEV2_9BACI|nr:MULTISPECIES: hypothetical protein [Lysinibacillus]AHN24149.1 hypothetical protein T479_10290 [Lysinibacillus varians]TKI72675.1 hypothetical protein FC756_01020 [Lysinibacillus mangiferihumi]